MLNLKSLFPDQAKFQKSLRDFYAHRNDFVRQSILDNGIQFISQNRLFDNNIEFYIIVESGSLDDPDDKEGIAHFLEHLLVDPELNHEFEQRGGNIENLATSFTTVRFSGKIPNTHENQSFLADVFKKFLTGERISEITFDKEKKRILNEIGIQADNSGTHALTLLGQAFRAGRADPNIMGNRDIVRNVKISDLQSYLDKHFSGPNIYIAMTGKFDHQEMHNKLNTALSTVPSHTVSKRDPLVFVPGDYRNENTHLMQLYFHFCFPSPAHNPAKSALYSMAYGYLLHKVTHGLVFGNDLCYHTESRPILPLGSPGYLSFTGNLMPEDGSRVIPETRDIITTLIEDGIDIDTFNIIKSLQLQEYQNQKFWRKGHSAESLAFNLIYNGSVHPFGEEENKLLDIRPEDVQKFLIEETLSHAPAIITYGDSSKMGSYEEFAGPIQDALARQNQPKAKL